MSQPTDMKYKTCKWEGCGEFFEYDYRRSIHSQAINRGWSVWQSEQGFVNYVCPTHTIRVQGIISKGWANNDLV